MAIQRSLGRLQVDLAELEQLLPQQGFPWLPIRNAHLLAVAELEGGEEPRDPFVCSGARAGGDHCCG